MVWDADGYMKERDKTCEIVDQSAVCAMFCVVHTSTSTIHNYTCYIHSTSKYALYDTVHLDWIENLEGVWGGESSISV